jgi:hypothetical protein
VKDGAVDVWPELFGDVVGSVLSHLTEPALVGFDPDIGVVEVVGVTNACGGASPDGLGDVEGPLMWLPLILRDPSVCAKRPYTLAFC